MSVVVTEIMNIYQDLLGVTFQEIKGETWHPGVFVFSDISDGNVCNL